MSEEKEQSLYQALGGRPTLEKVHKIFYDILYAHPWLGQYFTGLQQHFIEAQQTDFMTSAMGGPEVYCGKFPPQAHKHMYITDELFSLRQSLLKQSLKKANVPDELAEKWLKIDGAFRGRLVKKSLADCEKRHLADHILNFPNPQAQ